MASTLNPTPFKITIIEEQIVRNSTIKNEVREVNKMENETTETVIEDAAETVVEKAETETVSKVEEEMTEEEAGEAEETEAESMDEEDDMDHWPLILNLPLHDGDRRQARWHTSVTFGTLWSVRQELPSSWRQRLDQIKQ